MQPTTPQDLDRQIAELAYQRFLARGGQHGRALDDWLAAEAQLKRTYDVVLVDAGTNTIEVVRALRELTGLSLAKVRAAIASVPWTVKRGTSHAESEAMRAALERLAARVELAPAPSP